MSIFVKNIAEIQKGVKVEGDTYFPAVDPYLIAAENDYLLPYLGKELFELLSDPAESAKLAPILDRIQTAVSCFSFYHIINEGSLKINEHGAAQSTGDMTTTPAKWRDDNQKSELIKRGDKALDSILDFLMQEVDDYPAWKSSKFYLLRSSLVIGRAADFNDFVPICESTRVFLRLIPDIRKADRMLEKYLCGPLYARVKAHLTEEDDSPEAIEALMPYLREVVAYEAITRAIPRFNFFLTAEGIIFYSINDSTFQKSAVSVSEKKDMLHRYRTNLDESRSELAAFLRDNISEYPEYASSPCSGQKISTKPFYAFENKSTNKFFSP
jgi:hypothetical protein